MTAPSSSSPEAPRALAVPPVAVPPVAAAPPTLLYHNPGTHAPPPGWTNVTLHALRQEGRRSAMLRAVGIRVGRQFILDALIVAYFLWEARHESPSTTYFILLPLIVGLALCGSAAFGFFRTRSQLDSFRLVVADQGIQRCIQGYPRLTVEFAEVTRARAFPRGILLRTARRSRSLSIPSILEGYDVVVERVAAHVPITRVPKPFLRTAAAQAAFLIILIAYFAAYFLALQSSRLAVELPLFLFVLAFNGICLVAVFRNPQVRLMSKILSPAIIILAMLALLVKIILVYFHPI